MKSVNSNMSIPGVCAIKPEYLVVRPAAAEHKVESLKHKLNDGHEEISAIAPEEKKSKFDCDKQGQGKFKNKSRGQNKSRPKTFQEDKCLMPCRTIVDVKVSQTAEPCQLKNCILIHDPIKYLKIKPKDISPECYIYSVRGHCPRGLACRFATEHITAEGKNLVKQNELSMWKNDVLNGDTRTLQYQLERRKYDLSKAEQVKNEIEKLMNDRKQQSEEPKCTEDGPNGLIKRKEEKPIGAVTDEDIVPTLPREKKALDWNDKLYLSPLTTVGNLPFRRICKEYGADITCGEMALCESLLKGNKQEWALLKRHTSEDMFGVQICASSPNLVSKVAQVIDEHIQVDFVDLNLGCPIDLVYQKGGGCGMMLRQRALEASVRCASSLLSVPFTVKMRTGVYQDKKIAHTLLPSIVQYGAAFVTLHGRSREARYSRLADWNYIEQCARSAAPIPVYGNGDILSYDDYIHRKELAPSVRGVMIGRGALIKPWIFTEIKEQRMWDIRSSERFDIIKKYVNYGLHHWGSDTMGVENTRRFLLEWLSFLYRYVPVGLLERAPQRINERPPTFFGRDDLETLMASGNCSDWIKISEMLLGPVPPGFNFLPKHKASAYK